MVTTLFITTMITPHHNDLFVKTLFSTMILIPNQVKEAVILGHDGNVWAASQDFSVSSKAVCCLICLEVFLIVLILTKVKFFRLSLDAK